MIQITNLHKYYRSTRQAIHVLKGIDLTISERDFVSIMGPSGSGKSTLLNILGILDGYDDGNYQLAGYSMSGVSEKKAAKYRNQLIGFIFQSFHLIPFKNAMENVALPLYYQGESRKKRNQLAMSMLEKVGLEDRWDHFPSELSGGQSQRVAIARALITKPKIILADEPTGALDTKTSTDIVDLLKDCNREGMTIIVVTHDPEVADQTNSIIKLRDGKIEAYV